MTAPARYQATLRALVATQSLSHAQARAAYRSLKERYDRPVTAADVKAHPRISRDAAKEARRQVDAKAEFAKRSEAARRGHETRAMNREIGPPGKIPPEFLAAEDFFYEGDENQFEEEDEY